MSDEYSSIAIAIALASAIISGLGFSLSWKKRKIERLSSESQFISSIYTELLNTEKRHDQLQNPQDAYYYALDYLNIIERLCFFNTKQYLTEDIIDFFKNYLKEGLAYYNWLIDINAINKNNVNEHYANLVKTCNQYKLEPQATLTPIFENHRLKIKQSELEPNKPENNELKKSKKYRIDYKKIRGYSISLIIMGSLMIALGISLDRLTPWIDETTLSVTKNCVAEMHFRHNNETEFQNCVLPNLEKIENVQNMITLKAITYSIGGVFIGIGVTKRQ